MAKPICRPKTRLRNCARLSDDHAGLTLEFYFAQLLTGLANAASLFLIAAGLSVIFGVTKIVNFAHGSFFMLGAYVALSAFDGFGGGALGFWGGVIAAALAVGLLGLVVERVLLRRLYDAPELFALLATFGLLLIIQDATLAIWGAEDRLGPRAPGLDGAVRVFGEPIPDYDLALIAIGPLVLGALWLLLNRTRWGVLLRAATQDRDMVDALGVDPRPLFAGAVFLGAALAGLGGALQIPREAVSLQMDLNIIAEAFVVVVVGGLGSVGGAFVAAILISVLNAFAVLIAAELALVLPFAVMAIVLILRPHGLFGAAEGERRTSARGSAALAPVAQPVGASSLRRRNGLIALGVAVLAAPIALGDVALTLATDLAIAALFAASLHFLLGVGGMITFGHAAYFGLGAYGAALAAQALGAPMLVAMALGAGAAGMAALLFGWVFVRREGVYLAMLTLAAAQMIWGVAILWRDLTGGDDGVLGVWPPDWAGGDVAYYLIALALCGGGVWLLRRAAQAPFGAALRGGRDSAVRAAAIGLDLRRHQWAAFGLAGAAAGLAGAVFAFAKGSVFPDVLSIAQSVDGLLMVLIGG
ncbi:MAG: ABC transporter permease, partial [Pseudomonadota bacterium]